MAMARTARTNTELDAAPLLLLLPAPLLLSKPPNSPETQVSLCCCSCSDGQRALLSVLLLLLAISSLHALLLPLHIQLFFSLPPSLLRSLQGILDMVKGSMASFFLKLKVQQVFVMVCKRYNLNFYLSTTYFSVWHVIKSSKT